MPGLTPLPSTIQVSIVIASALMLPLAALIGRRSQATEIYRRGARII